MSRIMEVLREERRGEDDTRNVVKRKMGDA
jgi:hypothetical protein